MSRCLNLTRAGEYAIAALARLALIDNGAAPVTIDTLAQTQDLPRPFLSKIMQHCTRAGLVRSKKGAEGGVVLTRRPQDISLLSIIEACEGRYARGKCVFYASRDCSGEDCVVFCPLRREEENLKNRLGATTLADMARALDVHPGANAVRAFSGGA